MAKVVGGTSKNRDAPGSSSKPPLSSAEIGEFSADAKAHLDALVATLSIPVPLLMALAVTARTVGAGVTPDVSFQGVKMPLAVGSMLIIAFNGLMLLHVARLTALVSADWRRSGEAEKVRNTITRHSGLLNPFFGIEPFDGADRILHFIPRFSVGMLLGFHLLFILTPLDVQSVWGGYLLPVGIGVAVLHIAGNFLATVRICALAEAILGWTAVVIVVVGYLVGAFLSYQTMIALGA